MFTIHLFVVICDNMKILQARFFSIVGKKLYFHKLANSLFLKNKLLQSFGILIFHLTRIFQFNIKYLRPVLIKCYAGVYPEAEESLNWAKLRKTDKLSLMKLTLQLRLLLS